MIHKKRFKRCSGFLIILSCLYLPFAMAMEQTKLGFKSLKKRHPEFVVHLGGFLASNGKAQFLDINDSNGNWYTFNNGTRGNWLFGAGYYLDAFVRESYNVKLGLDWLFLVKTPVQGFINVEQTFQNLSYSYTVQNVPVYFAAKVKYKGLIAHQDWILDFGVGPNFMRTSDYSEKPLTDDTIANNQLFASRNNTTFSAMAGLGIRIYGAKNAPSLEFGYRFLYLGQGTLAANDNQLINTISTGQNYANMMICGVVF